MKLLQIKRTKENTRFYLFGIRILKLSGNQARLDEYIRSLENRILDVAVVARTHAESFGSYKNYYTGKNVVLVATGPSLAQYVPIENAIHIGVNRAFYWIKKPFDALFIQDYNIGDEILDQAIQYSADNESVLFLGLVDQYIIPESTALRAAAKRYYTDYLYRPKFNFAYDISSQRLGDFNSVVFSAMQFLLWTNPKRIYLVGCDCNRSGYFDNKEQTNYLTDKIIEHWALFKEFAHIYYPETEIISVNPVGLRGMFQEIETTSSQL